MFEHIATNKTTYTQIQKPIAHTWIELNKTAFDHNIAQYKKIIGQHRIFAFVSKSNAYGHSIKEMVPWVQTNNDINWLCVSQLSEALHLRNLGITKPILVMYTIDDNPEYALSNNIAIMVGNIQIIKQLETIGRQNKKTFNVHVKIDTGMSRFGFSYDEIQNVIKTLLFCKNVFVQGIYTHFADADNADTTYTTKQLLLFKKIVALFKQAGIRPLFIHCANSAAASSLDLPETNFFRIGAGAYGLWASQATQIHTKKLHPNFSLQQILTWKTYIEEIRTIERDQYVSYSLTYKTDKKTRIAILPIGYHDGYHRRLSNTGIVRIGSHYAPVIGRVGMNTVCIDITHIPQAQHGDEVILLGNYPELTALEMAHTIGSFNPREVTVRLNPSIPRIITT